MKAVLIIGGAVSGSTAAQKIHGITTERALLEGDSLKSVLDLFAGELKNIQVLVGHNIDFDNKIVGAEFFRCNSQNLLADFPSICLLYTSDAADE